VEARRVLGLCSARAKRSPSQSTRRTRAMISDQQPPEGAAKAESPPPRNKRPRPFVVASLFIVLVAVVAGAIWGVSRSAGGGGAAHAPLQATATPAPRVLYRADWSQGANGWTLPAGATLADGRLQIASSDALSLQIPYVPTTPNYAVEM